MESERRGSETAGRWFHLLRRVIEGTDVAYGCVAPGWSRAVEWPTWDGKYDVSGQQVNWKGS